MDKVALKAAVSSGNGLTAEQQEHIAAALDTHDAVLKMSALADQFVTANPAVGAFDWTSLLGLLSPLLNLIPGIGPIVALLPTILGFVNAILAAIGKKPIPPIPVPAPPAGDFITPTPVA